MIAPAEEAGFADAIRTAQARRSPLAIEGLGSKSGTLRPMQTADTLSTSAYAGISLYAPKELIVTARAGTTLAALEATLAESGQRLIAEPPSYEFLGHPTQTVGGMVAANLSGPRRIAQGAMRDHLLGIRAVTGRGEIIRSGGRVLKNVTGLDLCKLFAGSYGTLGVLTEVTLKVLPAPELTGSLAISGLDPARGVAALARALGSPFGVTGAVHLPQEAAMAVGFERSATIARIEDVAESVPYRLGRLRDMLAEFGPVEMLEDTDSRPLWESIRDAVPLGVERNDVVWRVSVAPSHGPEVLHAGQRAGLDGYLDWGGGLVFLAGPADPAAEAAVTGTVRRLGGGWWLMRAPEGLRASLAALPEEPPALAAIRRRVVDSFDPAGILNPGRLHAG